MCLPELYKFKCGHVIDTHEDAWPPIRCAWWNKEKGKCGIIKKWSPVEKIPAKCGRCLVPMEAPLTRKEKFKARLRKLLPCKKRSGGFDLTEANESG
jgi:hypothetical protein